MSVSPRSSHWRAKQRTAQQRPPNQPPRPLTLCEQIVADIHKNFVQNIPISKDVCHYCVATACALTEKDRVPPEELEWICKTVQSVYARKPSCALCPVGILH